MNDERDEQTPEPPAEAHKPQQAQVPPHPSVDTGPSGFARFLILLLLVFAVAGFGLVTLCGGVFTIAGLGGGEYIGGVWVISVPSLLIGGVLCWLCARQFLRFLRRTS